MKKFFLTAFIGLALTSFSQESAAPCCSIVGIDSKTNHVIARNNVTGQLFSFKADALDIRSMRLKDPVIANSNFSQVTAISGAVRKYTAEPLNVASLDQAEPAGVKNMQVDQAEPAGLLKINFAQPCCSVVEVQVDNAEPVNSTITARNKATGNTVRFKTPSSIAKNIMKGDPVYAEPSQNLAVISNAMESSGSSYFSYYVADGSFTNDDGNTDKVARNQKSETGAADRWIITLSPNMKGVLGKLDMNFPAGVDWNIWIYTTDNKMVNSFYQTHNVKSYNLSPGNYRILLNDVTIEQVPVEKGKETRIKAGVLNIESEGNWDLYNDTKEKTITIGTKPKKMVLPVGNYYLKLGGNYFPAFIKDKETVIL